MSILYLIRGLPGSGKTTLAKQMSKDMDIAHFEADMFFEIDGEYKFDPKKLGDAHAWCLRSVADELFHGYDVIVSNTFTTKKEMNDYLELTPNSVIIECKGNYGSVHNVPEATLAKMRNRWVPNSELGYFAEYKTV
jgi:uridine kinase